MLANRLQLFKFCAKNSDLFRTKLYCLPILLIDSFNSITDLSAILFSKTIGEFQSWIESLSNYLGFDHYGALVGQDQPSGNTTFFGVQNADPEYLKGTPPSSFQSDPVSIHCRTSSLPLMWGDKTYSDAGQMDQYEFQRHHGYGFGIAMAYHLPHGRHFMIGFDRDQPLPNDPAEITRIVSKFHLFSLYAQEAAKVALSDCPTSDPSRIIKSLTPREVECMKWTIEGKTTWEVGMILNISEFTAKKFLKQAIEKLGCTSKIHAVAVALRAGIL